MKTITAILFLLFALQSEAQYLPVKRVLNGSAATEPTPWMASIAVSYDGGNREKVITLKMS